MFPYVKVSISKEEFDFEVMIMKQKISGSEFFAM